MNNPIALAVLIPACLLAGCATQPSVAARSDAGNAELAATVPAVERPQNPHLLAQHLDRIKACRQQLEDETQGLRNAKDLYEAGRLSSVDRAAAEAEVTGVAIRLIDAQLELARSGLLPPEQATDRESHAVQDVVGTLPSIMALLDQKLAACESLLEQAKVAHTTVYELFRAGRATMPEVQTAELNVLIVEKQRNDVRREREAAGSS